MARLIAAFLIALMPTLALAVEPPADDHGHATTAGMVDDHAAGTAGEHEHAKGELLPPIKQGLPAMIAAFIVFIVVLLVLSKKAWPVILGGLNDRVAKIQKELDEAEMQRKSAKSALDEYEKNLADARAETQRMLEETKAKQQELASELKAKAEVELGLMRERATRDIDAAKRAAINEIYTEAAETATAIASKILRREISAEDQRRLVEESLAELQSVGSNGVATS